MNKANLVELSEEEVLSILRGKYPEIGENASLATASGQGCAGNLTIVHNLRVYWRKGINDIHREGEK